MANIDENLSFIAGLVAMGAEELGLDSIEQTLSTASALSATQKIAFREILLPLKKSFGARVNAYITILDNKPLIAGGPAVKASVQNSNNNNSKASSGNSTLDEIQQYIDSRQYETALFWMDSFLSSDEPLRAQDRKYIIQQLLEIAKDPNQLVKVISFLGRVAFMQFATWDQRTELCAIFSKVDKINVPPEVITLIHALNTWMSNARNQDDDDDDNAPSAAVLQKYTDNMKALAHGSVRCANQGNINMHLNYCKNIVCEGRVDAIFAESFLEAVLYDFPQEIKDTFKDIAISHERIKEIVEESTNVFARKKIMVNSIPSNANMFPNWDEVIKSQGYFHTTQDFHTGSAHRGPSIVDLIDADISGDIVGATVSSTLVKWHNETHPIQQKTPENFQISLATYLSHTNGHGTLQEPGTFLDAIASALNKKNNTNDYDAQTLELSFSLQNLAIEDQARIICSQLQIRICIMSSQPDNVAGGIKRTMIDAMQCKIMGGFETIDHSAADLIHIAQTQGYAAIFYEVNPAKRRKLSNNNNNADSD